MRQVTNLLAQELEKGINSLDKFAALNSIVGKNSIKEILEMGKITNPAEALQVHATPNPNSNPACLRLSGVPAHIATQQ